MRRWYIIVAVLLSCGAMLRVAAAAPDETRMYRVAEAAFKDGLNDLAERQFAEYLAQFPDSDRADGVVLDLAQAQLNQGKWEAAVKTLQDALAKWPTEKRPDGFRFWLAEALSRGERYIEAEQRYSEVIEKYPHSAYRPQALYGLAFARFKLGHFNPAMQALDEFDKLGPKADLAQEGELLRGQVHLALQQFDKAETVLASVVNKYPEYAGGVSRRHLAGRITLAAEPGRRSAEALRCGHRFLQVQPEQTRDWRIGRQGLAWRRLGVLGAAEIQRCRPVVRPGARAGAGPGLEARGDAQAGRILRSRRATGGWRGEIEGLPAIHAEATRWPTKSR